MNTRIRVALGLAVAVLGSGLTTGSASADATRQRRDPVTRWLDQRAHVLDGVEPTRSDADLAPLGAAARNARIVGLGEAEHGLAEITTLKHRALRYLVEHEGFRSIAWEEDWSLGTRINDYVLGRRDDRDALVEQPTGTWRNREVVDVPTWLRAYNSHHQDKARFFGVEFYATRSFAYDGVELYVASAAPGSGLREAASGRDRRSLRYGRLPAVDLERVADKAPCIRARAEARRPRGRPPHRPGDRCYALAEQAARQI